MVKDTDPRTKSKSRDRRERRTAPAENLLFEEEEDDEDDAVEPTEEPEPTQPESSTQSRVPQSGRRRDTIGFDIDDPEAEDLVRREYYSKDQFRKKVIEDVDSLWEQLIQREARWTHRDLQTSGDARLVQLLRTDIGQLKATIVDLTQERDEATAHRDLAVKERNEYAFRILRSSALNPQDTP
ncbi:hypothetical protein N7448_005756 [Penicillium atrosanguineum]|nr:hypothetical protein N7448_005756 [Penicillium atrosanguineum]